MTEKVGYTTNILSAFWIVDNLWAIAIVVLPCAAWSSAACTTFSEAESSAEVAYRKMLIGYFRGKRPGLTSSSSRTLGFRRRARAIAIRSATAEISQPKSEFVERTKISYVSDLQTTASPYRPPLFQNPYCGSIDIQSLMREQRILTWVTIG